MAFTEILTSNAIVPEVWLREVMEEYLRQSYWNNFTGTSDGAVIMSKAVLGKGQGDAINIPTRSQLIGGLVTGANKVSGNEGRMEFYNQRITIDNDSLSVKQDNIPMNDFRAAFSVMTAMRQGVVDARRLRMDDRITSALSDTSTGRVRGRYLYGATDSNWNATHATAQTAVDNTNDQMTTAMASICKRKATIPLNAHAKIRPMMVRSGQNNGFQEWYKLAMHPYCARDLTQNDAQFRQPHLLIPPNSNPNSPLFTGSRFLGGFDGVLLYQWEGIFLESSTIQVAHNLFCGAQAGCIVWGKFGTFEEELSNYKKDMGLEHHEINGISKLMPDRNTENSSITNEDHGTVHCFAAAVAD